MQIRTSRSLVGFQAPAPGLTKLWVYINMRLGCFWRRFAETKHVNPSCFIYISYFYNDSAIRTPSKNRHYLLIPTSSHISHLFRLAWFDKVENLHSLPIHIEKSFQTCFLNSTLHTGSLLERYRFFTPRIPIGFSVVLLPILLFGIYALASIQTPSKTDTVGSTRTVSLNKKNQ